MPTELLLASSNQGKLAEFLAMANIIAREAQSLNLALLQNFSTFPLFPENAPTFAENAAGKALHYSKLANACVLADDSGLVVPALNGAPGVFSARYAGPDATSAERNTKLLGEMRNLTGEARRAYFVCVLAVAEKGRPIAIVSASAHGEIALGPSGGAGFGYDPIFFIPALNKTFAELSSSEKNQLSHRGKAFRRLQEILR
jgi:XTP/dITP diphosphohydrolase